MGETADGIRVVDASRLERELSYPVAIAALERAFRELDPTADPPRSHVSTSAGTMLVMPAISPRSLGVKVVTVTPANADRGVPTIQAIYVLLDGETGSTRAVLDGTTLTAIRTAAVSALATKLLAREGASRLVVFGAGVQGAAHVEAIRAVRPIDHVTVISRTPDSTNRLVERIRADGVEADAGRPADVEAADIVCTCTTSSSPVFDGSLLPADCHVNAVGTYTTDARELDEAALRDAFIVVETRQAAVAEAGDLVLAFGEATGDRIDAELADVVRGRAGTGHHTVFKSVGLAFEDLAVAGAGSWAAGHG